MKLLIMIKGQLFSNRSLMASCLSLGMACSMLQVGGGDAGGTKEVESQLVLGKGGEIVRIDKFKNTWNLKGTGAVKYECKAKPCTEKELSEVTPDNAKRAKKNGDWKEYVDKELPNQSEIPAEKRKKKSFLSMSGKYVDDQREGPWKLHREDETVLKITNYSKGKKNGWERKFSKKDEVVEEKNYVNDELDGAYFKKTDALQMEAEGSYKAGKMVGTWKSYYILDPEGKPLAKSVLKNEAACSNDLKSGGYKSYGIEGKVASEGEYSNGFRQGAWKMYHPNGALESEGQYQAIAGAEGEKCVVDAGGGSKTPAFKQFGPWKHYYDNGQVFAEGNKDVKRVGFWKFYSNKGVVRFAGTMKNDLQMEEGKVYDANGQQTGEGKFFVTVLTIDEKTKDVKETFKPALPFTYFRNGKKWIEISKADEKGEITGIEYDENGARLGEGPMVSTLPPKKNGCWTLKGKKVYYIMDAVKEGKIAGMMKCE